MALENSTGGVPATMLVGPANGYGNNGMFGDGNGWWILLLFFLLAGNNGWGGYGGGESNVQRGFDQAELNGGINALQNGLCSGFAGVNASINNGVNVLQQQLYSNQIADMQNAFAMQSQFANCCCENRLATVQTQNIVQGEGAATRLAIQQQTQAILDKMCQDKIDAKNDEIARLRQEIAMKDLAASQGAQTAAIQAGQRALANEVEQYVLPTPRPAYVVQNPNCCQQNFGCGCAA